MSQQQPLVEQHQHHHKKRVKVDDRIFFKLMQKVGAEGYYQRFSLLLWCVVNFLCGGIMLMTPFLFYQDPYVCPQSIQDCFSYVCQLSPLERSQFIPNPTITSLANTYGDYRCQDEKYELDKIESFMFFGMFAGYFSLAVFGGMIGRKMLMMVSMGLILAGLFIAIFSTSIQIAGFGMFLVAFGANDASNVTFFFLSETVSESYRQRYSVIIQVSQGIGVVSNIFTYYIFKNWIIVLVLFFLIPALIVTYQIYFKIKDTPFCLVTRYYSDQALAHFTDIAKMNEIENLSLTIQQIQSIQELYEVNHSRQGQSGNFNLLDLFKYSSLKGMTIIMILMQMIIVIQFYAPALIVQQFKFNIYLDVIVVGFSQLAGYLICIIPITKWRRKQSAYLFFGITCVASFILAFIWQDSHSSHSHGNIWILVLIFIFRLTITMQFTFFYVYMMELYPTQVRVMGTSAIAFCGGLALSIAPELVDFFKNRGVPIMYLFLFFSLMGILASSFLPESFEKVPPQVIQELKNRDSSSKRSYSRSLSRQHHSSIKIVEMGILKKDQKKDIIPTTLGKS